MAEISGMNFIGELHSAGGSETFQAKNPATDKFLLDSFHFITIDEMHAVTKKAASAFPVYHKKSAEERADFLETIAQEIIALGDDVINIAMAESGLPFARLTGERNRTTGQLQMFAKLLREGSWVDARIDTAMPERQPLPKPDLRSMLIPIGPVLVFGASNFPFAYSAAGGDTASALAAGCPVIVKAHPSHPGTDELISQAIINAAKKTNMPDGVYSMVHCSNEMAIQLVTNPAIKAVGFTGSRNGGMAIFKAAVNREEPIPVYAEMSAVNPVIILPGAMAKNAANIALGYTASVTQGVGQFCTNPGLLFVVEDENSKIFLATVKENVSKVGPAVMLSKNICSNFERGLEQFKKNATLLVENNSATKLNEAAPHIFTVTQKEFINNKNLSAEVFGPAGLIILCQNVDEIAEALKELEGQLTATVHAAEEDEKFLPPVLELMQQKAGRVLFGGFPTGVEVNDAIVHGGPFPATTDGRSTSVGTGAILRFVRPVAYQNFPQHLLPDELKDKNPKQILRTQNGTKTKDALKI